jgi:hypothetical protein
LGPYLVHDIYETDTNWTETTATWNNPPNSLRKTHANYQDNNILALEAPATTVYTEAKSAGKQLVSFRIHSAYPAGLIIQKI